ncbi:MAG: VWA domain-containing protein [Bacteroidota bacterium]
MFRFANIDYLYAFALIPVLIIIFWIMLYWKKRALRAFGDISIINQLMPFVSKNRPVLKFIVLLFALAFMILGIANPQIGSKMEEVKREGVDLMIALDVSNSMMAEDIKPSRLERAKQAISKLIDKLHNDRIGLVVFGGEAFIQLPITTDYSAAKMFLSTISTDIVPTQGTAIGEAIDLSIRSFSNNENNPEKGNIKNKAIIIITDGENHEDDAVKASQGAAEKGIVVHTIGMGLVKGAPIPIFNRGKQIGFRKDKEGNTIITKLDEIKLQQIASAGNGTYIMANNIQTGLSVLFTEINKMEKVKFGSKIYTDYEDRFQYFIAVALLLLILELFISERKNKWLSKINLFGK